MKLKLENIIVFVCILLISKSVYAEEYFGIFLDKLRGEFIVDAEPRPKFELDHEFRFEDPNGLLWVTPSGTTVDGASIPPFLWSIIGGPFEDAYIEASVIHDHYCETEERTAHDTHRNFYYGMMASGVPKWKAMLMHWAVATFGPSWKLEKRVVMEQICTQTEDNITNCSSVATIRTVTVRESPLDLSSPEVLALAISKTNAVARTLLTSDGKTLDVSSSGEVSATLASIESNSNSYRRLFKNEDVVFKTDELGLLSQSDKTSFASIQPWEGDTVPSYEKADILSPRFDEQHIKNQAFKLGVGSHAEILNNVDLKAIESTSEVMILQQ